MPKNINIKKTLVIGSGPIIIGQAAEFDYSGTQCCEALREEGIEVVLVNSNPATIMTDFGVATYTYIEPLSIEIIEKIIQKERPDSIIAGMGGQTGLNISCELHDSGILEKYNVKVIGTSIQSIKDGEDRELFKEFMNKINEPVIESKIVTTIEDGVDFANTIGYPVIVRPAYTLGGTGGGIAENEADFRVILESGLLLSRVSQVLVEKSIKGYKEIEYEVVRDGAGNCITVCNMENIDPVGVHTGDSIVVAPSQTLADKEHQMLRSSAIKIINEIGIVGGCNVQFALDPYSFKYAVIEINPRVSRSSALASKATGYPIAKVATKIALGYNLDEIVNTVTGKTFACFEPALDYVVVKIPKWPFDKFENATRTLGTKMMATGEVMAIGNSFESAFLKGIRSLEIGQYSLIHKGVQQKSIQQLKDLVVVPDDERIFVLAELLRRGYKLEKVCEITGMDIFFVNKIKNIVDLEVELSNIKFENMSKKTLKKYKEIGFSDKGIADILCCSPSDIYRLREEFNLNPTYKTVDTCAGEFEAVSPYYYSTYDLEDEVLVSNNKKVVVLGSGPIRIGQGIEFDYCSVQSIKALKKAGYETIIINNNPETVSTDFDIADKLYFEPLTEEDVLSVLLKERPEGVVLQFGGQTAIKLARFLEEMNIKILGTKPEQIDIAEDREKFEELLEQIDVLRPKGKAVRTVLEGVEIAEELEYPVLVRPSYVLGGQGMEITYDKDTLVRYLSDSFAKDAKNPVLIDKYLNGVEIEVDAIYDGESVLIPGIMEHLEHAGVHSGDSMTLYPSVSLSDEVKNTIVEITEKIAKALKVIGMINIQFIEYKNKVYVIEVNPRSSRTVPYISKVSETPIIEIATNVMIGTKLKDMGITTKLVKEPDFYTVKVPVFSTEKLPQVEISLGPQMRSTGEVLGIGYTVEEALYKGFTSAGIKIPKKGDTILATIKEVEHERFNQLALRLSNLGINFYATEGTRKSLKKVSVVSKEAKKISQGVPNILDIIRSGVVDLVIDIPSQNNCESSDSFKIRRFTAESNINILTSLDTVEALIKVMEHNIQIDKIKINRLGNY